MDCSPHCTHRVAVQLWEHCGDWASRYAATLLADPSLLTRRQMASWVHDIRDEKLCLAVGRLFSRSRHVYALCSPWCMSCGYVRLTGLAMLEHLARGDRDSCDCMFVPYLSILRHLLEEDGAEVCDEVARVLVAFASRGPGLAERVRRFCTDLAPPDGTVSHPISFRLAALVGPALEGVGKF
ncbi:MAG: hypothetical protein PHW58_03615 [Candidatus Methanofastidiosa archaeon]|nr:hypothetical protein [Candidatus Methanofastidiosa archaeon]